VRCKALPLRHKDVVAKVVIDDIVLRVSGSRDVSAEARVAALQFAEEMASYTTRDRDFRRAHHPIAVPRDAPAIIREMARLSALVRVGPAFTLRGALLDYVGLRCASNNRELVISCEADHFVAVRRARRLPLPGNRDLALIVRPGAGPKGVHASYAHGATGGAIVAVVAESCILADAGAAAATAMAARPTSLRAGLAYLSGVPGIHGAFVMRGDHIGLAGSVEIAA
jgi:ApbE superfamily uncharacterized protein (UPF0280 family)